MTNMNKRNTYALMFENFSRLSISGFMRSVFRLVVGKRLYG
jgi:hypothetical protein